MSDTAETLPDQHVPAETASDTPDEGPIEPGLFRTRVVPAIALTMVAGMLGLLAYAMFAPDDARNDPECRYVAGRVCELTEPRDAPDFEVETFDGGRFLLSEQRGKIVVVNFWGSWCEPCRDETPLLETASGTLGDDVVLFGVNVQDTETSARAFLEQYNVTFPTGPAGGDAISVDYGVTGYPETFVVDAQGQIVAKIVGQITSLEQVQAMVALAR